MRACTTWAAACGNVSCLRSLCCSALCFAIDGFIPEYKMRMIFLFFCLFVSHLGPKPGPPTEALLGPLHWPPQGQGMGLWASCGSLPGNEEIIPKRENQRGT